MVHRKGRLRHPGAREVALPARPRRRRRGGGGRVRICGPVSAAKGEGWLRSRGEARRVRFRGTGRRGYARSSPRGRNRRRIEYAPTSTWSWASCRKEGLGSKRLKLGDLT